MRGLSIVSALLIFTVSAVGLGGAKEHFINGQEYYDQGSYKNAIDEFEKAYSLDPKPLLLYNLAQAHEKLGQLKKSVDYLKRYLKSGSTKIDNKMVENKVENLERRIQQTGITVTVNEDGADIFANDKKLGTSPVSGVLPLDEGMHKVLIVKKGFKDFTMNVGVSTGHSVPVDAKLEAADEAYVSKAPVVAEPDTTEPAADTGPAEGSAAATEGPEPVDTTDEASADEDSLEEPEKGVEALDIVPWAIAGVGAVTAVVGWAALGIPANKDGDKDKALIADVVGFVGVGIAAGGAIWGILRLVKKKKSASSESARLQVVPLVDPHGAGATATLTF